MTSVTPAATCPFSDSYLDRISWQTLLQMDVPPSPVTVQVATLCIS